MNRTAIKSVNQIKCSMKYIKPQKCYFSTCNDHSTISKTIRNAQATEILRNNFYQIKNQESFIPLNDLDHLIVSEKIRPSLFINIFELTGKSLGMITRYSPSIVSNIIIHAIDESATQQFNDSIRNIQATNNDSNSQEINMKYEDIKETLKFHRDLRYISEDLNENNQSKSNNDNNSQMNDNIKLTFTTLFYHILKISEKY